MKRTTIPPSFRYNYVHARARSWQGIGERRGGEGREGRSSSSGMAGAWLAVIFPWPAAGCSASPLASDLHLAACIIHGGTQAVPVVTSPKGLTSAPSAPREVCARLPTLHTSTRIMPRDIVPCELSPQELEPHPSLNLASVTGGRPREREPRCGCPEGREWRAGRSLTVRYAAVSRTSHSPRRHHVLYSRCSSLTLPAPHSH